MHKGKIVGGISLLVIGIVIYATISNYQAQCKSLFGQVGQYVDPTIQQRCTIVNYGIILAGVLVLIGMILAIIGAVSGNRKGERSTKIFCRYCGRESSAVGQFCPVCGRNLQAQSTTMKQCINCGSSTSEDSIFCANCGKKFGEANLDKTASRRAISDVKYMNQNFILRNFKTIIIIEGVMIVVLLILTSTKG